MKYSSLRNWTAGYYLREWTTLMKEIWKRLYSPILQPSYVFFFLISIVIGATGVWVAGFEAYLESPSHKTITSTMADGRVFNAIITFFAAVGSVACIQFIVVEDRLKHLRAFFCLVMVVLISLAVMAAVSDYRASEHRYYYLIAGTTVAILTWWIANWDEGKYRQPSSLEPLGGDSDETVAGDTKEFSL